MSLSYFDTSYLVRLYFDEPGWREVRELKTHEPWACALHGRSETLAAFHRKFREGCLNSSELTEIITQFDHDCLVGEFHWLPITEQLVSALAADYRTLPASCFLRSADALHLSCARDHGFKTLYSNDDKLLAAAKHFGLRGKNVISRR